MNFKPLIKAIFISSSIIPIAALLIRLFMENSDILSLVFVKAGESILDNFDLILAITLSAGLTANSKDTVTAPLAATVALLTCNSVYSTMDPSINTGILLGIFFGLTSGVMSNIIRNNLPSLKEDGYFTPERFAPIFMIVLGILMGIFVGFVWPTIQIYISHASVFITSNETYGPFLFGVLNRLLVITGLHHVLNSHIWIETGSYITSSQGTSEEVHGDMIRFIAGDPTAGIYESGFYLIMLFGLPALTIAIYKSMSISEGRFTKAPLLKKALIFASLSSILIGVTEPIEYMMVIAMFRLFLMHALLTGMALSICQYIGIHHGFAFSGGLIDYFTYMDIAQKPLLLLPLGLLFGLIYYKITMWYLQKYKVEWIRSLLENPSHTK